MPKALQVVSICIYSDLYCNIINLTVQIHVDVSYNEKITEAILSLISLWKSKSLNTLPAFFYLSNILSMVIIQTFSTIVFSFPLCKVLDPWYYSDKAHQHFFWGLDILWGVKIRNGHSDVSRWANFKIKAYYNLAFVLPRFRKLTILHTFISCCPASFKGLCTPIPRSLCSCTYFNISASDSWLKQSFFKMFVSKVAL